ncbi:LPXTG cell wall anchor domain-containing protein [Companilactobacillus alimentarius]|uniref:NEAT domain-containing protein n=1 Tax=Companilactobacillus alimentarius DSM 20249 TaxID=1423720 RepID=A0A2K9HPC2_9LACO|nr:LPXTG cell wall anchor domain-containing protein [Companilactobacillus alimentarius]AUI72263.1 hypothetical protein LA20249_08740 [Companilactobacillus alimentarius DSM 20249]KRK77514.1 hypothetical protein FC67_GL000268 [Companilactobacillus alimentarius DSM 20249]MDT6952834.1 LPXTG cell wall anchor domain-containing protein [Companilactobacillus alimentarius]GEO45487.1 hypothetical protein LAL01_17190 [Companilactobacillus alimentarius]
MKKWVISLLSVGILWGTFGVSGSSDLALPNSVEETVQADVSNNNDERTINYEVYKKDSSELSPADTFFTKSAEISSNDDGTYKVTITAEISNLTSLEVTAINEQNPSESASYMKNDKKYVDISFNIKQLSDLEKPIDGTVQTKLINYNINKTDVSFKFDSSSLDELGPKKSFSDSLKSITDAETENNSVDTTDTTILKKSKQDSNIIATPDSSTQTENTNDNKGNDRTILKELTYKVDKSVGDGALISPYFTNTAKVIQDSNGTYYVELTVKYPKKFGNSAIKINYLNHQKPINLSFTSVGDSNYLRVAFPISSMMALSKDIDGNVSLNLPEFGIDKNLNFKLDFGSVNTADLTSLTNNSDLPGLLSKLGKVDSETVRSDKTDSTKNKLITLPQTGEQTDGALGVIGGLLLILWIVLIKETYLKK